MAIFFGGCYGTDAREPGRIHTIFMDEKTGRLKEVSVCRDSEDPSYLAIQENLLYAVRERKTDSRLDAYRIAKDGSLVLLNSVSVPGSFVCHVGVFPDKKAVSATSYGSGIVSCCPVAKDGSLGPVSQTFRHKGNGPVVERQAGPHAHSSIFDPTGRFLLVADLGCDALFVYGCDENDCITPHGKIVVPPGEGPRHMVFHPTAPLLYVVGEVGNHLMSYRFDAKTGSATLLGLQPLSEGMEGSTAADVHVSKDGAWLWTSTRGENTISTFALENPASPRLVHRQASGGKGPRNFCVSESEKYLLVANMDSGTLSCFSLCDGMLQNECDKMSLPHIAFVGQWKA